MSSYRSRAGSRLPVVWDRLSLTERRIVCELGGLVAGVAHLPSVNLTRDQLPRVLQGMRATIALAEECRFALAYSRQQPSREVGA